ncbi:hypothetical protein, partial [Brotocaccenecus cirricatena]|uniref:hypothetical protein n=1 Tax=Brotocaccenecus cirricatena TaxID=3064195 RepID=UPI0032BF30F6
RRRLQTAAGPPLKARIEIFSCSLPPDLILTVWAAAGAQTEYGAAVYAPGESVWVHLAQTTRAPWAELPAKLNDSIRIKRALSIKHTILQLYR